MFIGTINPGGAPGIGEPSSTGDTLIRKTTPEQEQKQQYDQLVFDAGGEAIVKLASDLGLKVNENTIDYLMQYYLSEQSRKNAWNDSVFASQNQYQWLVDDLRKAGLNPFLALSGMNAAGAQSSGQSSSGGLLTSRKNNESTNSTNLLKTVLTGILSIIGIALFKKG